MRRLLPGYALSALGDGMSSVAVAWLALRLAPAPDRGLWVGAALAAYTLPGAAGMVAFGRWLHARRAVRLAGADAALRAVALGLIPVLAVAQLLTPLTYVCLLGVSSLLRAWGMAGQFTVVAEILPPQHRVAGNGLLGVTAEITLIGGPALAGVLAAVAGPVTVIAADAATFAVLAVSYAWAAPLIPRGQPGSGPAEGRAGLGWRVIRADRTLLGLVALTFVFYLLYGPVEVALPVHVASDLHGSAALLGGYWTAYAIGAVIGTLAAPYLRHWPVWPTMIAIVAGWGIALLPTGLGVPVWASLAAFTAGGVIYSPYTSLSTAVFQDQSPPASLGSVLAARSALVIVSVPLGSALGGPIVAALGAQGTLLASALATIALAAMAAAAAVVIRVRAPAGRPGRSGAEA